MSSSPNMLTKVTALNYGILRILRKSVIVTEKLIFSFLAVRVQVFPG
jgi:hypothetical protein